MKYNLALVNLDDIHGLLGAGDCKELYGEALLGSFAKQVLPGRH